MPDELEARVSALENQVQQLTARVSRSEEDAAAARVLAGGADYDVGEIRTEIREFREQNNLTLNALRQDFVDLRQEFGDLRGEMRSKFDLISAGQEQIANLIRSTMDSDDETDK